MLVRLCARLHGSARVGSRCLVQEAERHWYQYEHPAELGLGSGTRLCRSICVGPVVRQLAM